MIKKVLIGVGLIIAAILVYAAVSPSDFKIERSIEMMAKPAQIYPHLSNVRLASAWNPFLQDDPNTKITYAGPEAGVGASSTWESEKTGAGTATITEVIPNQLVRVRLDFTAPFVATHMVDYTINQVGLASKVTWSMYGKNNFISRVICVFLNQDKMVGGHFEKGLESLKSRVSNTASVDF